MPEDLQEIYLAHRDAMWRAAGRILRGVTYSGVSIEDVLQQVIEEVAREGLLTARGNPESRSVEQIRRFLVQRTQWRAKDAVRMVRSIPSAAPEQYLHGPDHVTRSLELEVEDRLVREKIMGLVMSDLVTSKQRYAFVERHLKDRPVRAVAKELDVSSSAVSQLVRRAAERILAELWSSADHEEHRGEQ